MAEIVAARRAFSIVPAPAPRFAPRPAILSQASSTVSSLIIRGSLSEIRAERMECAREIASLGGGNSARLAFRDALRAADAESIGVGLLARELPSYAKGKTADALALGALDCMREGSRSLCREAGKVAKALVFNLTETGLEGARRDALRLLRSDSKPAREAASEIIVQLCRHHSVDHMELAEQAYDTGTEEGVGAAKAALQLPPKIIDVAPAGASAIEAA